MNKIKIQFLAIGFLTAIASNSIAQDRVCGTDEMHKHQIEVNPEVLRNMEALEEFTREFVKNYDPVADGSRVSYVIPIVFHVIHTYQGNNISKAQILDALRIINEDFQKMNSDTNLVVSAFSGIIGNPDIEFKLAQLDPNGNCTDGITRSFSNLTFDAGENVKSIIRWPSNKYLNVWSVDNITSGAGAYAFLPSSGNVQNHGIVNRHSQLGSIGTSGGSNFSSRTLTHEIGHHFNLSHPWGGTNNPGLPANCSDDDFVSDTPNTIGVANQGCNVNQVTCGSLDNVQNYMDYSSCSRMFTNGQVARMHAALNSPTGSRNQLWTASNLLATGTNGTVLPACAPIADFNTSTVYVCSGTNVNFTDASWNGDVTGWSWSFPGGSPSSSIVKNPSVSYANEGTFDVSLTVSNASGSNSITRTGHVIVSRAAAWYSIPFAESFETITFPGGFWLVENGGGNAWESTTAAAYTGAKSIRLRNYSGNTQSADAFITPSYNMSNVSAAMMTFKMAFAVRSTSSTDQLKIYASTNCGQTWSVRYTKSGLSMATAGLISSNFTPTGQSQWREETVNLSTSSVSGRDNVMFKFEYINDTGNNLYIDDINITGVVGIQDISAAAIGLQIFPNPTKGASTVSFILDQSNDVTIDVVDMLGRTIYTVVNAELAAGEHRYEISNELSDGMYFVKLNVGGNLITEKLLVE